jgi:rhodanese-related sulfurtransferase
MRLEVTTMKMQPSRRSFLGRGLAVTATAAIGAGLGAGSPAMAGHPVEKSANAVPVTNMSADAAYKAVQAGEIFLIDIRRPDEWEGTQVGEGAIGLDMRDEGFVPTLIALRQANPEKPIALICATGMRSGYVTNALANQGFPGLVDISEGMLGSDAGPGWLDRGLPTYPGSFANVVERRLAVLP